MSKCKPEKLIYVRLTLISVLLTIYLFLILRVRKSYLKRKLNQD